MPKAILLTHAAATLYMVGVIWMVQLVHYPLFDGVGDDGFASYENRHTRQMTGVVLPAMVIELVTAIALAVPAIRQSDLLSVVPGWMAWLGLALVALIWGVTFTLSVPQHFRLAEGFDPSAHRVLVDTNWLRTVGWTLRAGLVLRMLALAMRERAV